MIDHVISDVIGHAPDLVEWVRELKAIYINTKVKNKKADYHKVHNGRSSTSKAIDGQVDYYPSHIFKQVKALLWFPCSWLHVSDENEIFHAA